MNIAQEAFNFLKREGYLPTQIGSLVQFKAQGLSYLIWWTEEDPYFFKLDARFSLHQFDTTVNDMLIRCNKLNSNWKIAKAMVIEEDDAIVVTTEILLDSTPEIQDILIRLMGIIKESINTLTHP